MFQSNIQLIKIKYFVIALFLLLNSSSVWAQDNKPAYLHDNVNAVLWQQHSAEYRALCFQAYNIAQWRLAEILKTKPGKKTRCVVVDIDETVLDNSPLQGREIHKGIVYDQNDWNEWSALAVADTVPGALHFLKYAAKRGVEIFYITNRTTIELKATLANLRKFNFPFADEKHLLLKDDSSFKGPRREKVATNYDIVLLCGDNLNDFADIFYKKEQAERAVLVKNMQAQFGKKFIVLPNPMYGDWETPLYDAKKGLNDQEKADIRIKKLKDYKQKSEHN